VSDRQWAAMQLSEHPDVCAALDAGMPVPRERLRPDALARIGEATSGGVFVLTEESVLRCESSLVEFVPEWNGMNGANGASAGHESESAEPEGLRTRGVILERVRPIRWLWARRIPMGLPSLIVGEEGVGKGTFTAWLVARATCGQLEGDLHGEPVNVLIVGDEDAFEPIWVPRLWAAGADLTKLRTLDDREYLDDLPARAEDLAVTVARDEIGLLVFDQLLDHISGGSNGEAIYNPKHIRQTMLPLRRVAGELGVAALGLLHPIKGNVSSFRQLVAGSHQLNAVSRSSLLIVADPDDENRRVVVRGKGNHSAAPRSFEFAIAAEAVELNLHAFEVPKVVNEGEGKRTIHDLLSAIPSSPVRDAIAEQLVPLLTDEPQTQADLARAVGREPQDGSVRNALGWLEQKGRAKNVSRGKWTGAGEVQVQPLRGFALSTPGAPAPREGAS
jgi:hypothetical protein